MRLAAVVLLVALPLAGCDDGGGSGSASGCEDVEAPSAKKAGDHQKPAKALDPATTYVLKIQTSCGDFEVTLDQKQSPNTASSLVALARSGYFDRTTFHRALPGFVIQGGDPTATGTGGPGYSTVDPPPADASYTRGVVAMAKTQDEPAGTAGSQFFVVTADDAGLPPEYAIVGEVTKGYEAVERIEPLGNAQTETPSQPVVVEKISVVTT